MLLILKDGNKHFYLLGLGWGVEDFRSKMHFQNVTDLSVTNLYILDIYSMPPPSPPPHTPLKTHFLVCILCKVLHYQVSVQLLHVLVCTVR